MSWTGRVLNRAQASRPWRAWQRYGAARGSVLAGGISYAAFFSIFPALAVGFTVVGVVLGSRPDLQQDVVDAVNDNFGTPIIKVDPQAAGIVALDDLTNGGALTITAVVGLIVLLFSGLGWLDAVREGLRAMFGQLPGGHNPVTTKLRDLLVLIVIGALVMISAVSGVVVSAAAGALLRWSGLDGSPTERVVLAVLSALVLLAVDVTVLVILFRVLADVRLPWTDLRDGALAGGIGLGVLKLFGGSLLPHLADNRFLATFALVVGLLVWLNLVSRVLLLAASWCATTAVDRRHLEPHPPPAEPAGVLRPGERPAAERRAARRRAARKQAVARRPTFEPVVSPRAADRVSVLSGVILGAAAMSAGMVTARAVTGAARSLFRSAKDDRQAD